MEIKAEAFGAAQEMARKQHLEITSSQLMLVLEAFLQANGPDERADMVIDSRHADPEYAARMKLCSGHAALVSIRKAIAEVEREAEGLPSAENDWQYKVLFDHLFDGDNCAAVDIRDVLKVMDRELVDYYDPDTTYREDAEAYIQALDETIEGFRKEIAGDTDPDPEPQWRG